MHNIYACLSISFPLQTFLPSSSSNQEVVLFRPVQCIQNTNFLSSYHSIPSPVLTFSASPLTPTTIKRAHKPASFKHFPTTALSFVSHTYSPALPLPPTPPPQVTVPSPLPTEWKDLASGTLLRSFITV